jgi:hypothetical protein
MAGFPDRVPDFMEILELNKEIKAQAAAVITITGINSSTDAPILVHRTR